MLDSQPSSSPSTIQYHEAIREAKRHLIIKTLEETNGVYTEAAKRLGIHPNYLHRLIRLLGLRPLLRDQLKIKISTPF